MRRAGPILGLAALAVILVTATPAPADVFEPIALVSGTGSEQAVYAHDPAISGDGRYVAFDGYFCGNTGVWRRDLQTGAVEPVAVGEANTPAGDGQLPSISQDGRFVSFTTTAPLDPADDFNTGPDVYVRDMSIPAAQPCEGQAASQAGTFTLASAVDGSERGLSYQTTGPESHGSLASGRTALSADGRHVAFVTTAVSNLAGPATPSLQVAVRNLDTRQTQLVSAEYDRASGHAVPGRPVSASQEGRTFGAVYTATGEAPQFPFSARSYNITKPVGASISADASTVSWIGVNVSQQAAGLTEETLQPRYAEPLWRRIADGQLTPTRRITGGSDPGAPNCNEPVLAQSASASDPCQGPFVADPAAGIVGSVETDVLPQLSGDGRKVAFLADANLLARGSNFGLNPGPTDLYLADMSSGLTRVQALRELTAFAGTNREQLSEDAPIVDLGISPDGSQVAFSTQRTTFPLGSPAFVSAPRAVAAMAELFDVDLANDTLTRVSAGFDGTASEHPHEASTANEDPYALPTDGALSPSFSGDGATLAFSSTASNLVYGDGNTPADQHSITFDGSDAFVVHRKPFTESPTPQQISPAPQNPTLQPVWSLGVTARSTKDGKVVLQIEAPGAGTIRTAAHAMLAVHARNRASLRRGAPKRGRVTTTVVERAVAAAGGSTRAAGTASLTLALAKPYRSLAVQGGGQSATVTVTFSASGHRTLRQAVAVTFRRTPAAHHHGRSATSRGKR
jgi:Tol biopolymer transport system component